MHKPTSEFDRWDGHRWVEDKEAARKARIDAVRKHKAALSEEAETRIAQLERKVRLELASDEEKELLKAWEIYTIKLDDINPEITTDIKLPEKPE
ncbi:tail fiber assembly protein [Escherichia coli]|nr:tail fiber assembly protein [Escherichia coli]